MKQEMNKCFNIYASKIMECEKLEHTVKQLYYCYYKYNGYEYAKDYKEIVNELTSENKEALAAKIESCGNLEEVEKKELLSYLREHDKVKAETINRFAKQMVKFWNEQAHNAYDFPSLDIWFKDGSYLKFFIDLRKVKILPIEVPAFAIAYDSEEGSMEFPFAAPSVLKESLSKAIKYELTQIANKVDLTKEVERVYRNVLSD